MTIRLRHAARLEDLAMALAEDLAQLAPDRPFALQTILVAHAGMARWLRAALAHASAGGIAAGCAFLLPGELLQRLGEGLPEAPDADDRYRPEVLRLALFALFGEPGFAVAGESDAERFRRAGREAERLGRLAIYRGDWLESWQHGQSGGEDGRLWRALRARLGPGDRPTRVRAIAGQLAGAVDAPQEPLFVFGLGHCAPDLLGLIDQMARHTQVTWYLVNPCRDYWLEFRSPRSLALAARQDRDAYLESGPPLLASLGGQSRALWQALLSADAVEDAVPERMVYVRGRLGQLQQAIHDGVESPRFTAHAGDPSLCIHACASPLGELESVREALDAALVRDPTLRPDEVVVMAVDPGRYRPWLESVFGGTATPWPIRVADLDWLAHEPWFQLVATLLDIAGAPIRRSAWLGILGHSEVQRHWRLDRDLLPKLARALDRVSASFGIDGADRGDGSDLHSLGAASLRLWRRFAADEPESGWALSGLAAETLAHAEGVLACLQAWRVTAAAPRTLSEWTQALRDTLTRLCGTGMPEHTSARQVLFGMLADLEAHGQLAGMTATLPFVAFRTLLEERLHAPALDAPAPGGGIRFTGLVPFRSLPFRFVAVLGLEDGAFPRVDPVDGEDPGMRAQPRLLDRDRRAEDRQLFLEALLSAREVLHLAYVARSADDGSEQPPSTLIAELAQVLDAADGVPDRGHGHPVVRDWLRHQVPLPFAPARFVAGTSMVAWWPAAQALVQPRPEGQHWPVASDAPAPMQDSLVRLSDIQDFLRHPGAWFAGRRLGLSLPTSYWRDPDLEPLDERVPSQSRRVRELVRLAITDGGFPERVPEAWASLGILPVGPHGERAFAAILRKSEDAAGARIAGLHTVLAQPERVVTIRGLPVGPWRIDGHVRLNGEARVLVDLYGDLGALLAEVLALVVAVRAGLGPKTLHLVFDWTRRPIARSQQALTLPDELRVTDDPDWSAWLERVLALYGAAHTAPVPLPWRTVKEAWKYLTGDDAARLGIAATTYAQRSDSGRGTPIRADMEDPNWRLLIGERFPAADAAFGARFLDASRALLEPLFARMVS